MYFGPVYRDKILGLRTRRTWYGKLILQWRFSMKRPAALTPNSYEYAGRSKWEDVHTDAQSITEVENFLHLMGNQMEPKTLHNSDISGARQNVKDIKVVGDGDMFRLLCKASSEAEGWMKSSKACEIPGVGCVVQVTTQQRNADGSYAVAEAVTFVPNVCIIDDDNGGRKLVQRGTFV